MPKTYSEKLKDPRWQKKRLEVMERDGFTCFRCRENEKPLHVHHLMYEKGKSPWDYEGYALITLCEDCHKECEDRVCKLAFGAFMATCGLDLNTARMVLSYAAIAAKLKQGDASDVCCEMVMLAAGHKALEEFKKKHGPVYEDGYIERTIEALRK